jgi:multidrug efflux pump subunit AcrB
MKGATPLDKLVTRSLSGGMPVMLLVLSLILGALALKFTPREEEPQIVVPMVDVIVQAAGLSARQVERQVTIPLEKLLAQIPGVENVYSSSMSGQSAVTLRFYVGEDREESILNSYNKLYSNQDKLPGVVDRWMLSPVEVDDVPIYMLALWSDQPETTSDFELRRIAEEVSTYLQGIDQTSEVNVVGGRPRTIRILPSPESLAARQSTAVDIINALKISNRLQSAGRITLGNNAYILESGDYIRDVEELRHTVINVVDGQPVFLQDVAEIIDGPAEPDNYSWIQFSPGHPGYSQADSHYPMVTISVAKQRGSNAVNIAREVDALGSRLRQEFLPSDVHLEVLRDYGQTANEKVSSLTASLGFAVFTVVVFIAVFLGWRPALVVGLAVPISYGFTLALDMAFGYTINRVTLFALILSLGLLVDDPITGVDNIQRYLQRRSGTLHERIVAAIAEIKVPLLMSTVTIILAFIPLAFITGMMGPYMAPMAFNVPVSVATSTLVAFLVTPWLAARLIKVPDANSPAPGLSEKPSSMEVAYSRMLRPILQSRRRAKWVLWAVLGLFIVAALLPVLRLVPLKLLPFDNKNEVQVLIDMPESATLEQTSAVAEQVSNAVLRVNEVLAIASYVGVPSPIDFNGMVRRYYQRTAPYMGELRVTLVDKSLREHQSHAVVLRLRSLLAGMATNGISIKVVEVPPGPPVLSTLVAEVYGSETTSYSELQQAAQLVKARLQREPHVVEVDTTVEQPHQRLRFVVDKPKAALSGVATDDINQTLVLANEGMSAGFMQIEREAIPLPLELRMPQARRADRHDLLSLQVKGRPGIVQRNSGTGLENAPQPLVAIGELGQFNTLPADTTIHRKDLRPLVYVTAELSGRTPAEVIADVHSDQGAQPGESNAWQDRSFLSPGAGDGWQVGDDIDVVWTGEGEWQITIDVFRDMGLAFMFALLGIFFVLKLQTASTSLSLIIMSAIPLTIIGIMPGFWLMNQFGEREIAGAPEPVLFTATAMIGMIALAGIVVRNSLILVEFITQARGQGLEIKEALVQAGAIRMRPILLTAGTTLLGNLIITLDPVFSGLALAIIFGIIASTVFTLLVVPVVYLLVFDTDTHSEA